MTPEMWLDLGPSHTVLDTAFPQIANPSGIAHGVALLVAWLVLTFYYVKGATFYIVTVSRLGGLGHQIFSRSACRQPQAAMLCLCRYLCGSDESCLGYGIADETARGQHSVLVRALLSSHWSGD